jgi:superfamily I DNA/RNA helicase
MEEIIPEFKRDESLDYLHVLKALREIPFPVGKNLLIDFLIGKKNNKSILKNDLDTLHNFNSLYNKKRYEIEEMIENLITNSLVNISGTMFNKFVKVLGITPKGSQELLIPTLNKKKLKNNFSYKNTKITDDEMKHFAELDFFLKKFNDEQKKAIISEKKNILCLAGAGTGKTTVLAKRIEFLVKYHEVNPNDVLAITFTKKARDEMKLRVQKLGVRIKVETFNSFCEKILQKYENKIYKRQVRVWTYQDKLIAMIAALENIGLDIPSAINKYFTEVQRRNKTQIHLQNVFMNDCFSVLDNFKSRNKSIENFTENLKKDPIVEMIYKICKFLKEYIEIQGLRGYTDQIIDTIKFFKENRDLIQEYKHILIDEYQDVNAMQIELIDLLNPLNLFCVGDPRQAIFGWRGSDINYILKFEEKYPNCEIIHLKKNYRSNNHVVEFMNASIRKMGLPDLDTSFNSHEKEMKLIGFESEEMEMNFIINKINSLEIPREEIFVLARTNNQLTDLSKKMNEKKIPHILKTGEGKDHVSARKGEVTLATIHSIKGLEADFVFVMGCTASNFPCKASDHPVIEMIKINEYDKEEEEKRLFYVAISRTKEKLYLTYTGKKHTYFINDEMLKMIDLKFFNYMLKDKKVINSY